MRLGDIFSAEELCGYEKYLSLEITDITEKSSDASGNTIFVARKGERYDGHNFVSEAVSLGCKVILAERSVSVPLGVILIKEKLSPRRIAEISAKINGYPHRRLKIIGITGTKGKTTTAVFLYNILKEVQGGCLLISTVGIEGMDKSISLDNTTPAPAIIYRALREAVERGIRYAVLEVSSQGIKTGRIEGLTFEASVFTGFSPDHIGEGEHGSVKEYLETKAEIFRSRTSKLAVVNSAASGIEKIEEVATRVIKCGENMSDKYRIDLIKTEKFGCRFNLNSKPFYISVPGAHNAKNAALALAVAAEIIGADICEFRGIIDKVKIPGRSEVYSIDGKNVVIDYAHNADSIEKVCIQVREYTRGRVFLLFGAVGGRTKSRRMQMAKAAESFADFSVITSDNPEFEDAKAICRDIACHFTDSKKYVIIPDRREAIYKAISLMQNGDCLILAGKGHEEYQLIAGKKVPFSEREILQGLSAKRLC